MTENMLARITLTNIPSRSPLMDEFQIHIHVIKGVIYKIDRKKKKVEVGIANSKLEALRLLAKDCNLVPI